MPNAVVLRILLGIIACLWALYPGEGKAGETPKASPSLFSRFTSVISSADGDRCSHVPSCSRYAREAVGTHGLIQGMMLSCDRLIRCGGDDTTRLPQVVVKGKRYAWDPVLSNDFWWKKRAAHPAPRLPRHFEGWE